MYFEQLSPFRRTAVLPKASQRTTSPGNEHSLCSHTSILCTEFPCCFYCSTGPEPPFFCTHKLSLKEAHPCNRRPGTQRGLNVQMVKIRSLQSLFLGQAAYIQVHPPKAQGTLRKRGWKNCKCQGGDAKPNGNEFYKLLRLGRKKYYKLLGLGITRHKTQASSTAKKKKPSTEL